MLHKYLIDIVFMMLNIIAPYNKILCTIINTQLPTHLASTLQKLTFLVFKVLENSYMHSNLSQKRKGR